MEYQNIKNLLDNTPNQPTKFRTKIWFEINDESRGKYTAWKVSKYGGFSGPYFPVLGPEKIRIWTLFTQWYDAVNQIRFKNSMLRSSLCCYSDSYILVKGTITVANAEAADAVANNVDKNVIFKTCAPFFKCNKQYVSR